jgi:aryl-alcohol dehydrogenase-like predicted oxidoreductase
LRPLVPAGVSLAQFALRWILMFDEVSVTIPGASRPAHVQSNVQAADLAAIEPAVMARIAQIYQQHIAPSVAHRW